MDKIYIEIIKEGIFYEPASKHYNNVSMVTCDRCYAQNIPVCYGHKSEQYDLCLKCYNHIFKTTFKCYLTNKNPSVDTSQMGAYTMIQFMFNTNKDCPTLKPTIDDSKCMSNTMTQFMFKTDNTDTTVNIQHDNFKYTGDHSWFNNTNTNINNLNHFVNFSWFDNN